MARPRVETGVPLGRRVAGQHARQRAGPEPFLPIGPSRRTPSITLLPATAMARRWNLPIVGHDHHVRWSFPGGPVLGKFPSVEIQARIDQAARWWLAVISMLTAATSVMFVAGLKYAGVAAGTVLSSTSPLFAIALGLLFLREPLTPRAVLGSIITVLGIAVLQL